MKPLTKPASLRVLLFFALLIPLTTHSQPIKRQYLVSQIDGDEYTMKYQYDSDYRLTSFILFNKKFLNDVKQYHFQYLPQRIVITSKGTGFGDSPQTLKTDIYGHVIEGTYDAVMHNDYIFFYNYKFTYSGAGYLQRINYYSRQDKKLQYIYQLTYENGNLTDLQTTFNAARGDNRGIDFSMTYYNNESVLNMNFLIQILFTGKNFFGEYLTEKIFMGIPGELFGVQSNKLISSITYRDKSHSYNASDGHHDEWDKTYQIKYDMNDKGLITAIIIDNHVFKVNYKTTI